MKIWVDDMRPKPDISWFHAMDSTEAIRALEIYKGYGIKIEAISLDHDLGGDDTSRKIVLWMCDNGFWPTRVYIHTANVVGREWLEGMVNFYGPGVSK